MKYRLSLILLVVLNTKVYSFSLIKSERSPKSYYEVRRVLNKYKVQKLEKNLRSFVKACRPSRMAGSVGHKNAAPFLINFLKGVDSENSGILSIDSFTPNTEASKRMYQEDFQKEIIGKYAPGSDVYQKWERFTTSMIDELSHLKMQKGKNIIWEKKGTINPEQVLILGAHYDTIAFNKKSLKILKDSAQPGADNNGSGVSILLSMIEVLSEIDLPKTVRIVFFDMEEFGFLGSRAYISKYGEELKKVSGYLNLLMLGHDSKIMDKLKRRGNMKAYIRKESDPSFGQDKKLVDIFVKSGSQVEYGVKFQVEKNSFNSSGHTLFWQHGVPSVVFSQDWENDYNAKRHHSANDFVETLNIKTLENSFRYLTGGVISWAFDLR